MTKSALDFTCNDILITVHLFLIEQLIIPLDVGKSAFAEINQ